MSFMREIKGVLVDEPSLAHLVDNETFLSEAG
jgi:hypothetical protein